jgi:UDP-glucose 4-epimerase
MKVLITGGAGYVGQSLIQELIKLGDKITEIIIYDNLSRANYNLFFSSMLKHPQIRFVQGELLDSRKLKEEIKKAQVVYHLAAKVTTPFADVDSHYFEQINHWGTANLVEILEESPVEAFINLSSATVYGPSNEALDESAVPHPNSFYGMSKLRAEGHIKRILSKLPKAYIIRAGNVYGYNPSMRMDAVINRFMFEANFKNRINIHGDGNQKRAFIHVNKLAEVIAQLPFVNVPNGTFNLAEHNLSVNEVSDYLKDIYPSLETLYINQHLQMVQVQLHQPCRIHEYIQFTPKEFYTELMEFKEHFSF